MKRRFFTAALLSIAVALAGCSTLQQSAKTVTPLQVQTAVTAGKVALDVALAKSPNTAAIVKTVVPLVVDALNQVVTSGSIPSSDALQALLLTKIPVADQAAAQGVLALVKAEWETYVASAPNAQAAIPFIQAIASGLQA